MTAQSQDVAETRDDIASKSKAGDAGSWWKDSKQMTAVAALLAAAVPLTAAVNGFFQVQNQKQVQTHEIRLKYLDRAIDSGRDAKYRERVLSFLVATLEPNDPMRSWAVEESDALKEVLRLREDLDAKTREAKALRDLLTKQEALARETKEGLVAKNDELQRLILSQTGKLSQLENEARIPLSVLNPQVVLLSTGDRGESELVVDEETSTHLAFSLVVQDTPRGQGLHLRLTTRDDELTSIWEGQIGIAEPGEVTVTLPSNFLGPGRYVFSLYEASGGSEELVEQYRFRVRARSEEGAQDA